MIQRSGPTGLVAAALLAAAIAGACSLHVVSGTGPVRTETRPMTAFTKLEASFGMHVDLAVGPAPSLAVEAPEDLLPIITTQVKGDTLEIKGTTDFVTATPVTIHVSTPDLESVNLFGGSIATIDGLAVDSLGVELGGGAQLTASGSASTVAVDGSGGSQLHLDQLTAGLVTLDLSGGAQASINATDTVLGEVSGGAHASVHGPAELHVSTSGGGSVDHG
jgi:hypothetical protein